MASTEDSRPFTVLHKMADEFKASLDSDIQQCLSSLDSQITNLVCNPDSKPATAKNSKLSVYVEFSKAKFDIFKSMEEIVEQMESSWKSQIQDIAKQFLENVEIFLAGTKLETTAKSPEKPVQSKPKSPRLYPSLSLLNTAKHIPVLNSFLSPNKGEVQGSPKKSTKRLSASPKKPSATIFEAEKTVHMDEEIESSDEEVVPQELEESENMEVEVEPDQLLMSRTARKSIATSRSSKKAPAKQVQFQENLPEEVTTPVRTRGRPKAVKTPVNKNTPKKKLPSFTEDYSTADILDESVSTPKGRGRRSAKTIEAKSTPKVVDNKTDDSQVNGNTPKVAMDIDDDLEIYSPVVNLTRSAPRRKTVIVPALNDIPAFNLTPDVTRGRSKRKTMGFVNGSDVSVAPSPKRLKRGARSSMAPSSLATEPEEPSVDPLESEESSETVNYSPWISLQDLTGQIPTKPGIYELRVFNAKKAAYIGACDSLRSKLTLHKLKQATGHKQLDRYVERNHGNVVVRYEVIGTVQEAKVEEKRRVGEFSKMYNTTPAYN